MKVFDGEIRCTTGSAVIWFSQFAEVAVESPPLDVWLSRYQQLGYDFVEAAHLFRLIGHEYGSAIAKKAFLIAPHVVQRFCKVSMLQIEPQRRDQHWSVEIRLSSGEQIAIDGNGRKTVFIDDNASARFRVCGD